MVAADFNGDGLVDLASANRGIGGDISIMLAEGNGAFGPAQRLPVGTSSNDVLNLRLGDFNGDLIVDIATVGLDDEVFDILVGFGNGNFAQAQTFDLPYLTRDLEAVDLDGNGLDDLVLTAEDAGDGLLLVVELDGHTVL